MNKQENAHKRFRYKIIYLELTNACNFTCDYCPIDQQIRKKMIMPTDFARRVIDQITENNLSKFLTFHLMGEPFLHKDLCQLVGYAEAQGLKVRLLTNGSLLKRKLNQELFEKRLTRLEISFRTPIDSSFKLRLRRGSLIFEEYIHLVKDLIEEKIQKKARTEICIKLFIQSYAAALKLGNPYKHLTSRESNMEIARLFQTHTLNMARKYGLSTEKWEKVHIRIRNGEYPIFPGINIGFSRIQDFWVRKQRGERKECYPAFVGGCSAGFRDDFGILANGDVTTCCLDYDEKNVIGNLQNQSLMEVLESAEAKRIQRSFRWFIPPTQFCRECIGGPTFISSVIKQTSTIAIDLKDRFAPRKEYKNMLERLNHDE